MKYFKWKKKITSKTTVQSNFWVISGSQFHLVEETGVPRENHQHVASHWQTLSRIAVSSCKFVNPTTI
jgi:hypothetical protein